MRLLYIHKYIILIPDYFRLGFYQSFMLLRNKTWEAFKYYFFIKLIK